jgi:biotin carboxyl carrier protein
MIEDNNLQNASPLEIIDNLKRLGENDSKMNDSLEEYLDNLYYFLKAKALVLLELQNDNWNIVNSKNISQELFNSIGPTVTNLSISALQHGFAYEQIRANIDNISQAVGVAFKIKTQEKEDQIVFFLYEYIDKNDLNNLILKTQLINDILVTSTTGVQNDTRDIDSDLQYILNINTEIIGINEFKLACNTIVNDISVKFDFDKVSLGVIDNDKVKLISISHTSDFEKNNTLYEKNIAMYEESIFQDEDIILLDSSEPYYIVDEHKSFYTQNDLQTLLTFPIRHNDKIIGVIQAYSKSKVLSEKELIFLRLTINKIAPTLYKIYTTDLNIAQYIGKKTKDTVSKFMSPKSALSKFLVILSSLFLLYILLFSWEYEVSATSVLSTEDKASISTPFDGIIDNIFVKVGDSIQKDQKLFSLDIQELKLKELESKADIIRYQKEQEFYMSQRKLADMAISQAKVSQAKSKLKRIQYNINNSTIRSTISGTVVQGDKEKLLGMPINKGDTVFYISNSTNLFIEIKVPEDDIYHIKSEQEGKMILLSDPLKEYTFRVDKIIPKAQVDSANGNVYVVHGILDEKSKEWWHPGMSGVVKINTGPKNIFWILTHNVSDFLRIYFW